MLNRLLCTLVSNSSNSSKNGATMLLCQRWFSEKVIPTLAYSQFKNELKSNKIVLLDVREKDELITDGKIKDSKNIPLGEIVSAFELSDENFKSRYGFTKPSPKDSIITHCKLGVRAMKAAVALNKSGFESVSVYPGIKDWVENGGPLQK